MKKYLVIAALAVSLGGCAAIQNLEGTFNLVTTATVEPSYVNIAINTYAALKQTAVNYGSYCVTQKFPQPVCSAANRRAVIRFVKAGDGAVETLEPALASGQPLLSTTYNALIGAVNGLKTTPITTIKSGS